MARWTWISLALATLCFAVSVRGNEPSPVVDLPWWMKLEFVNVYLKSKIGEDVESTDCLRPCIDGQRRICYKRLYVENYQAMGAACGNCSRGVQSDCHLPQCVATDGFEKGIISINRQLPGPLIDVCWNDLLVIDVVNKMHSESFSIHWHGQLQRKTPYMDGVPYTTQCPINPLTSFRYTFYAENYGTYFYHSHSGMQRYNGAYGGLVVRLPKSKDPLASFYDEDLHDHVLMVTDWSHESVEMFFVGLPTRLPGLLPRTLLINGKGRFHLSETSVQAQTPYKVVNVEKGKSYRIRIVNAGSTVCPVVFQIQDHQMHVIATDGDEVSPKLIDTLMIHTGERYDIVVEANQPEGTYWILAKGVGACLDPDLNVTQTAVLSYSPGKVEDEDLPPSPFNIQIYPPGVFLGDHMVSECHKDPNNMCVSELQSLNPPHIWKDVPDQQFFFRVLVKQLNTSAFFQMKQYKPFFNIQNNDIFLATMNGISHKPPRYPLISQEYQIDKSDFCDDHHLPDHCREWDGCICTHVVYLRKNSLVEFVYFDESVDTFNVSHPMHLHGVKFVVMSQKRFPGPQLTVERVRELLMNGELDPHGHPPTVKDTIAIQNQGVVVVRFVADNPGPWLIHCHIEDHMTFGMAMIMVIEGDLPIKPFNFPKCGPFV